MDEVFVNIQGRAQSLWRAIVQDGDGDDVFLQSRREGKAAKHFFRRLLKRHHDEPRTIVTNKLRSFRVAQRELLPEAVHDTSP